MRKIGVLMMFLAVPAMAGAGPREFTLNVEAELNAAGLMQHLLPRFTLKTGRRGHIVTTGGDALLEKAGTVEKNGVPERNGVPNKGGAPDKGGEARPAMARGPTVWTLRLTGENPAAARFADWLLSDTGQNSLSAFTPKQGAPFTPAHIKVAAKEIVFEGDVDLGKRLALLHCGRCHRVAADGTGIGIGSTPSFMALRALNDWADRFGAFYARNPHPSFMQIEGVSPPFDPAFPPVIVPVRITRHEMEAIQAYASRLAPANLGSAVITK